MVLGINQLELSLQPTYKPLKRPNMVLGTVLSTDVIGSEVP